MVSTSLSVKSNAAGHGGDLIRAHCSRNAAAARSMATSSSSGIGKMVSRTPGIVPDEGTAYAVREAQPLARR